MILSSADIARILGANEIVRLSAKIQIVDGKPALSGREGLYIYINRFPKTAEFEATFTLWIESDGSELDDLVIGEIKKLLPRVRVQPGLMTTVTTTEFRSESTQEAPAAAPAAKADASGLEARFEALAEDIQDQMLLIHSGRNGQDGKDGRDGINGRDGRDLVATEASLEDLQNVEQNIAKEDGQVLTWKDGAWQNLFIPQILSTISGGGGSTINALNDIGDVDVPSPGDGSVLAFNSASGNWEAAAAPPADISDNSIDDLADVDTSASAPLDGEVLTWVDASSQWEPQPVPDAGIPEAPQDGNYYVRQNGSWIDLKIALSALGVDVEEPIDAGNFTTGFTSATDSVVYDGGNFTTNTSAATGSDTIDGGSFAG
ncbi:fibritin [Synechococcus phage S-CRES3]|nr:fibritin [Synechococcus phage S-CRES3]